MKREEEKKCLNSVKLKYTYFTGEHWLLPQGRKLVGLP